MNPRTPVAARISIMVWVSKSHSMFGLARRTPKVSRRYPLNIGAIGGTRLYRKTKMNDRCV
jgi:hypothetical protein